MLNILYCGLRYDYGDIKRGPALEYKTMYDTLQKMEGVNASFFGIDQEMATRGRDGMNELLLKTVREQKPDLVFFVLFTEELKKETVAAVTKITKTFNWFGDDHWRVPVYSRFWAPLFTLVGTTDSKAIQQYASYGINNVIKTQWAANHFLYQPQYSEKEFNYNITFLGQNYGSRGAYIELLQKNDLPAAGYGTGFPAGSVTDVRELLNIYSFSKINLNFTETQYTTLKQRLKLLAKFFVKKELGKYRINLSNPLDSFRSMLGTQRRTIKARTFEVPACGGFLLTGSSDEWVDEYYVPGKEIELFNSTGELAEKCRYYLDHENERQAIAKAGYERTLKEHTYVHRFRDILKHLELEYNK